MLFTNRAFDTQIKPIKTYSLNCIILGEANNSALSCTVPVTPTISKRISGLRKDISITPTRSGNPRISYLSDADMFLILSSFPCAPHFTDDPRASGAILLPAEQPLEIIGLGQGDMRNWYECIIKAQPGDVFAVTMSSHKDNILTTTLKFYLVGQGEVIETNECSAYDIYRGLLGSLKLERPQWFRDDAFNTWKWTDIISRFHGGQNIAHTDHRFR